MAFETKEEVLHKVMKMEKPKCPHCDKEMSIWEVPPVNVGDGLGWGTPYLFVCFNVIRPIAAFVTLELIHTSVSLFSAPLAVPGRSSMIKWFCRRKCSRRILKKAFPF